MVGPIEHRGPDSEGRFCTSFAEVGFRRLSIIDLYAILTLEVWHKLFVSKKLYTRPEMTAMELFEIPRRAVAA